MKYLFYLITAIMLVAQISCKSESDVLIEYAGGEVTRGDFYSWMEVRRIPKESVLKSRKQEKARLERMAMDVILAEEARKQNFDKSAEYQYAIELHTPRFYGQYLMNKLNDKSEFKEEVIRPRIIKLYVKDYKIENKKRVKLNPDELQKAIEKRKEEATAIIKKLDAGESFDELAKKHSDDYSKKKGGDLYYIIKRDWPKEFTDVAFAMKKGTYTKEPVVIKNVIYIIKCEDKAVITQDNIDDVIEKEVFAKMIRKKLEQRSGQKLQRDLFGAKDLVKNFEKVSEKDPATVLFSVGNEKFTNSDLAKIIDYIVNFRGGKEENFNDNIKTRILNTVFREKVLMREARKRGFEKDKEFMQQYSAYKSIILAMSFMESKISDGITVTPEEVRKEYDQNKEKRYIRREPTKNKKFKKVVIPFKEIKDRIYSQLVGMKTREKRRRFENDLKKTYSYKIMEDELEGEKQEKKKPKKGESKRKKPVKAKK